VKKFRPIGLINTHKRVKNTQAVLSQGEPCDAVVDSIRIEFYNVPFPSHSEAFLLVVLCRLTWSLSITTVIIIHRQRNGT